MSFIDARKLSPDHAVEADVCVIGAGAAGLALASRFFGTSTRVVVLESGGLEHDPATQLLYRGPSVGQGHAPLDQSRLRLFGGTTNHWTAHVKPLDPIDFEKRSWVSHSGWPFGREELTAHYSEASDFLGLPTWPFAAGAWKQRLRRAWPFDETMLRPRLRQVVREDRRNLGHTLRGAMKQSPNVDTYLFANVLRIELDSGHKQVSELSVGTLSGVRMKVRARRYVLAAGGIENARILLLSSIGDRSGSAPGLVGAFFANHPEFWAGYLVVRESELPRSSFDSVSHRNGQALPLFALAAALQRSAEVQNASIYPLAQSDIGPVKRTIARRVPRAWAASMKTGLRDRDVANLANDMDRSAPSPAPQDPTSPGAHALGILMIAEPLPNPDSRVRLADSVDVLGLRRAKLDWRLQPEDLRSAHETLRRVAAAVGAAGLGRTRVLLPQRGIESLDLRGSHHHMGTTRMHVDPREGVVDANCRVHGLANLFVAGSSVFPTYGAVNPTLTIIALAFRLADHLRELGRR